MTTVANCLKAVKLYKVISGLAGEERQEEEEEEKEDGALIVSELPPPASPGLASSLLSAPGL